MGVSFAINVKSIVIKLPSTTVHFIDLQDTINKIYDAALEPNFWGVALESLAHTLGAEQGAIRNINPDSRAVGFVYTFNKDTAWNQPYRDHYNKIDPWLDLFLQADHDFYTCTHHHLSDKDYEATELHADFVTPQYCHYGVGGLLSINSSQKAYVSLHRDKSKNGFEDNKLEYLKLLGPHIQKALLINDKINHTNFEKQLLTDALNQIQSSVLLVDEKGEVLFINHLAEELIKSSPLMGIKKGIIYAVNNDDNNKLKRIINNATPRNTLIIDQQSEAVHFSNGMNQSHVYALIHPVNLNLVNITSSISNCAMIFLSSSEQKMTFSANSLQALYGFSKAEARLAIELCQGLTLDEISQKINLSKNTLRSQLRACFAKTNVDRQASLINLIDTGPAGKVV